MTEDLKELIAKRQQTHGDFRDVAQTSEDLLLAAAGSRNWSDLPPYMREGARMILHKLARALSGDSAFQEHWLDLAGYAERVRTIIEEDAALIPPKIGVAATSKAFAVEPRRPPMTPLARLDEELGRR